MKSPPDALLAPAREDRIERAPLLNPVRVRPQSIQLGGKDVHESLSSWMHRLSRDNGHRRLCSAFPSLAPSLNVQLASAEHPATFDKWGERLCIDSGVELRSIEETTFVGISGQQFSRTGVRKLLVVGDPHHKGKVRPAWHMVCPHCIDSMDVKFWPKNWRLATSVLCATHKVILLDRCTDCGVRFAIADDSIYPLNVCRVCKSDIGQMPSEVVDETTVSAAIDLDVTLSRTLGGADYVRRDGDFIALRYLLALLEWPVFAIVILQPYGSAACELIELLKARLQQARSPGAATVSFSEWPIHDRAAALRCIPSLNSQLRFQGLLGFVAHLPNGWKSYGYGWSPRGLH